MRPRGDETELLRSFEDCSLPASRFRHEDHVRLAWRMLAEDELPAALRRFREGLKRYATSLGKPDRSHETLTVAYRLLIHARRARGPTRAEFKACARRNPDLMASKPSALFRYYRGETLASDLARRVFLLPDRLDASPAEPGERSSRSSLTTGEPAPVSTAASRAEELEDL
jgi:hypothetical protein